MTPTHVSVQRCEGGCHQYGHSCQPIRTTRTLVPIILARCGIQSGLCAKECASLEVEEHAECACACQLTARDCPAGQAFRPELCACQCRDLPAKQACLDAGRSWHEAACSCTCQQEEECSSGLVFDGEGTCSCVPSTSLAASNEIPDLRAPRSSSSFFPSFELMVIAGLLTLILVLLILIFSLVIRIQKLSRSLRLQQAGAVGRCDHQDSEEHGARQSEPGQQQQQQQQQHSASTTIYSELNCSTPSSGFYSELAGSERGEGGAPPPSCHQLLRPDEELRLYRQLPAVDEDYGGRQQLLQLDPSADSLYHSAESVRGNKTMMRRGSDDYGRFPSTTINTWSPRVPDHVLETALGLGSPSSCYAETSLSPTGRIETRLLVNTSRDRSRYETASHHIDEALRLLQESAEQL